MPAALVTLSGPWCLFCFQEQRLSHSSHPVLLVQVSHCLALRLFIPLPSVPCSYPSNSHSSGFLCLVSIPFSIRSLAKCLLFFCEHGFLNCVNDNVLCLVLFLAFPRGLDFKAPFMLLWCTSHLLHLTAARSTLGIPHILLFRFLMTDISVAPTPISRNGDAMNILKHVCS